MKLLPFPISQVDNGCFVKTISLWITPINFMNAQAAAAAIHFGCDVFSMENLSEGLIHKTYKIISKNGDACILQLVNSSVFQNPKILNTNYKVISLHLE